MNTKRQWSDLIYHGTNDKQNQCCIVYYERHTDKTKSESIRTLKPDWYWKKKKKTNMTDSN